MKRLDLRRRT